MYHRLQTRLSVLFGPTCPFRQWFDRKSALGAGLVCLLVPKATSMVIGSGPQGTCDLVCPGQAKRRNNNQVLAVKCIQKLGGLVDLGGG